MQDWLEEAMLGCGLEEGGMAFVWRLRRREVLGAGELSITGIELDVF